MQMLDIDIEAMGLFCFVFVFPKKMFLYVALEYACPGILSVD